jgi:hypothetical protein
VIVATFNSKTNLSKKVFPFRLPLRPRLPSKVCKNANVTQNSFFYKDEIWVTKKSEFDADFESG